MARASVSGDGGFPANPREKAGYRLEFGDDFDGTALDDAKWLPYYLPHWSSRALAAARYALPGSCLQLKIEQDQRPWSPDFDGQLRVSSLQTGCFAGAPGSRVGQHRFRTDLVVREAQPELRLYTPRYGYFETRLKALPEPGYMVALWMIGFEKQPEQSAEICICEIFGDQIDQSGSQIGYDVHPFGDGSIRDEFHQERMPHNAANYHIYAAEWTADKVAFFVDNVKTRTIQQSPAYPMQFMLSMYELPDRLPGGRRGSPWPKVCEVDYVRGYCRLDADGAA